MDSLVVDDLHFEVRRSPRRQTVQITVDRGGELVLSAPETCPLKKMEGFVREKRFWIYTKLAEKEALLKDAPTKEYVSGEGFPYLGRGYRLLLVDRQDVPVKLDRGRFKMRRGVAATGRAAMVAWYAEHALAWLPQRVGRLAGRVGVEPGKVVVKDLGFRWGSCGKDATLNFHWRTILLPPRIIEYIVVHELAHLHEPHHTPEFWLRVERAMPDFAARKQWLAENAQEAMGV
ncbi:MAG: M48 family metallopeptidase [Myxococcales bacterium]|nr:M48 family metallopeptidase [Myxococcales bacterium]MCB9576016.1 M48 family metallopeptidase [Polyangiaceae bacterium]